MSRELLDRYYAAFNRGDSGAMLDLVTPDVAHEPSQGKVRVGKDAFTDFLNHMNRCYHETVLNPQFLVSEDGRMAAAEFMLDGEYLETDSDLPPATGQRYHLRVSAFFVIRDGLIARISNHYNLADWLDQVKAG